MRTTIQKKISIALFSGLLWLLTSGVVLAQLPDSLSVAKYKLLLNNPGLRVEAIASLNNMYNFRFYEAELQFNWMKYKYPNHPLPYFLLGLSNFWKMMPNNSITTYDDAFYAYMDTAIYFGEKMLAKDPQNPEAIFFCAGAYGFKGRLLSERGNFSKAGVAAKNALTYMKKSKNISDFGVEFMFGDGLYNFYREWVPENYKWLRPVMSIFPKGDKELGIKQLEEVSSNAFFTRVEAQYYLSRIYSNEERTPAKGYPIMRYLYETFPDNPYFHRQAARMSFLTGKWDEARIDSEKILTKVEASYLGYEANTARYASYTLGYIHYYKTYDYNLAWKYFTDTERYCEMAESNQTQYYYFAKLFKARIAVKQERKDDAIALYEFLKEECDSKSEPYKEAKAYLKINKPREKWFWIF